MDIVERLTLLSKNKETMCGICVTAILLINQDDNGSRSSLTTAFHLSIFHTCVYIFIYTHGKL